MTILIQNYRDGIGRIRREAYVLYIGQHGFDIDEVNVWAGSESFLTALRELVPEPCVEECLWLVDFVLSSRAGYHRADAVLNTLMDLVHPMVDKTVEDRAAE